MVPKTNAVRYGGRRKKIERLVGRLPEDAWTAVAPAGESPEGKRPWEWACPLSSVGIRKKGWAAGSASPP